MAILTRARDRDVEQRVVEGRAEGEQRVRQQQQVTQRMQPQPGGGELPLREEQRSEGARQQQAVQVDQAQHSAPRAQARRCGVQQPAARASELRGAAEVVEDAAACVGAAAAAPTATEGGAAAEAARGAAEE